MKKKRVREIIVGIPVEKIIGDTDRLVRQLQYDSRKVEAEDAFVAIRGFQTDGHRYLDEVLNRGCRVVFVEEVPDHKDATIIQLKDTRQALPYLALNFYDHAAEKLKIIGITGTNGKTTTAYLLHSILEKASWHPALISTVEYRLGEKVQPAWRTTPEALDLHELFYRVWQSNLKSVVMEVSSHALALHRTDGIPFWAAVFTNLGHDHLDFHHTIENYFRAKKKLFDELPENSRAITNLDDPFGEKIVADTSAEVFTYSWRDNRATVRLKSYRMTAAGIFVELDSPLGMIPITSPLIGRHNALNILTAATTAIALGLQKEPIQEGISNSGRIPGRCELFKTPDGARIYVDYAHTPDALQKTLQSMLDFKSPRLLVVFGCGGDRDQEKRPIMGRIATEYADLAIITNDNPRTEAPEKIIEEILSGVTDRSRVEVIPDRRQAIFRAVQLLEKDDILLVAGKGHENYQEIGKKRIHFDDREIVREAIALLKAS